MSLYFLFLILLLSSAFFSSSETAFFSLSRHRRHQLAQDPRGSARRVAILRAHPKSLLVTVLFGNELTNIAISIVSASILSNLFPALSIAQQALLSASFVVPTLLIFGEITPKSIAAVISDRVAIAYAYPLSAFSWVITPARWSLLYIADLFTRRFSGMHGDGEESLNEESFRALVDAGARDGVLEEEESALIHNAFHFNDRQVSEVMVPWQRVYTLADDTPISEAISEITQRAFSRVPLWNEGDERVRGILYTKDLLVFRWGDRSSHTKRGITPPARRSVPLNTNMISLNEVEESSSDRPVGTLAHSVVITHADTSLVHLLETFKRRRKHMAIVVDPDRAEPLGICTLEDILEVMFGPIHEESISDGELHIDDLQLDVEVGHD